MTSTFFGLELSRRALESQQVALDITGHNISNANTPGYTRQIGNLTATTPYTIPATGRNISIGSGVTLDTITRARSAFVDRQYRSENSKQQYWESKQNTLSNVEGVLNEPTTNALSNDMSEFWTSWSDLANEPENSGARSVVRERALTLAQGLNNLDQEITDMQQDLDSNIRVQIGQINVFAKQIQDLNFQIKRAEFNGDNPNDLKDKRDAVVDELSKIVSVHVTEGKDPMSTDARPVNTYKVTIGDDSAIPEQALVDDADINLLEDPGTSASGSPFAVVKWAATASIANGAPDAWGNCINLGTSTGSLLSDIESRGCAGGGASGADLDGTGGYLDDFKNQLNTLAQGIADAVNEIHKTGQGTTIGTGIDFFTDGAGAATGITAANISLNDVIIDDIGQIATGVIAGSVALGDGSVASAISSLATGWSSATPPSAPSLLATASSLGDYYAAQIAQLGVDVQQADRMKAGEDVLLANVTTKRESISGVSLDEEMINLIKFQKSYSAAARMVTMMDDMLSTILNMGVTR